MDFMASPHVGFGATRYGSRGPYLTVQYPDTPNLGVETEVFELATHDTQRYELAASTTSPILEPVSSRHSSWLPPHNPHTRSLDTINDAA